MELARANLVASKAPASFWTFAVLHATDVLNRTTGPPPRLSMSSYEALTGRKPRIMPILPFGCRAYAVKPRPSFSKTRMEPRAWMGMNLGRSLLSPGAYHIWVPSVPRVVTTSDVYFDESAYPWRPLEERVDSLTVALPPDPDEGLANGLPPADPPEHDSPSDDALQPLP
eukprot:3715674-Pleurochrysis_carterae.AAC.1